MPFTTYKPRSWWKQDSMATRMDQLIWIVLFLIRLSLSLGQLVSNALVLFPFRVHLSLYTLQVVKRGERMWIVDPSSEKDFYWMHWMHLLLVN